MASSCWSVNKSSSPVTIISASVANAAAKNLVVVGVTAHGRYVGTFISDGRDGTQQRDELDHVGFGVIELSDLA